MTLPIILLNGWPGVGKDTVAETLKLLLGDDKASVVDWSKSSQTEAFQPAPDDDDVVALRALREACFRDQFEHPALRNKIVICADCLSDTREGRRLARDFEVVANRCNRLLIPVSVHCRLDENMRRISSAERMVGFKPKSEFCTWSPLNVKMVVGDVSQPAPWRGLSGNTNANIGCACQSGAPMRHTRSGLRAESSSSTRGSRVSLSTTPAWCRTRLRCKFSPS